MPSLRLCTPSVSVSIPDVGDSRMAGSHVDNIVEAVQRIESSAGLLPKRCC